MGLFRTNCGIQRVIPELCKKGPVSVIKIFHGVLLSLLRGRMADRFLNKSALVIQGFFLA
jgi:hypothetical protein